MQILKFENQNDWIEARRGKITGSKVKDIIVKRGTNEKQGYYQLIAERLAIKPTDINPMDRGHELEQEAVELFGKKNKKKFNTDLVIWQDEEIPNIALSPDGYVEAKKITEAIEVKCLGSARHVEAIITKAVPKDYEDQIMWYFVVNPDLETLYVVFYDPRMIVHELHSLTILRSDYGEKLEELKSAMIEKLKSVEDRVRELTKGTDLDF